MSSEVIGLTEKVFVAMSVLIGDVNQDGAVSTEDINLVQAKSGATVTSSTFQYDTSANGIINSLDITVTQSSSNDAAALFPDFAFTGHYYHARSGLYLMLYRPYTPSLGRWLSRDPIGEAGGINLYAYVGNNGVNAADSLGLYINIVGDTAYRIQVRNDLQRMRSADPVLRAMIDQLFRSENRHVITMPIKCPSNPLGGNGSLAGDIDNSENGIGTNSTVEYDPSNWISPVGEVRDPSIALTHEVRHSQQYDFGTIMRSINPNSGVVRGEEWGVRRENIMRGTLGYPQRNTYGGLLIQNPYPR